jgi:hypothetical protein
MDEPVQRGDEDRVVEGVVVAVEVNDLPVRLRPVGAPVPAEPAAQQLDVVQEAVPEVQPVPDDLSLRRVVLDRWHPPLRRMRDRHVEPVALEQAVRQLPRPRGDASHMVVRLDVRAELVQRQDVPGDRSHAGRGGGQAGARRQEVDAEVRLAALLADVPAGGRAAGRAAARHVGLVEIGA